MLYMLLSILQMLKIVCIGADEKQETGPLQEILGRILPATAVDTPKL